MASLSIRKLDDKTYARLRVRAAERGVSMEEEVRRILTLAVRAPVRLGDLFREVFGESHGVELEIAPRAVHPPIGLLE